MEKKLPLGVNEASVNKMFAKIQNQTGLAPSQIIKGVERGSLKISLNKEQRSSKYLENDGIIRFKVTSDNTSAKEWLRRLNSFSLDRDLKDTIREQLIPSNGINYEIVILRKSLLKNQTVTVQNLKNEAKKRNFKTLNLEAVCLIREKFSSKELEDMGINWIITMQQDQLITYVGGSNLRTLSEIDSQRVNKKDCFAFLVDN